MRLANKEQTRAMTAVTPLDQHETPYLDELLAEKNARHVSFHMPGHKGAMPPNTKLLDYWGGNLHPADVVETNGIIDYLHSPRGALLRAQQLAAAAYGADETFFLINGSTVGNVAEIMTAARDGQKVIVPRASHRSVYGGLVLSGAVPVYVAPDYHPLVGSVLGVDADQVRALLAAHPDAVGVHNTSPNYYGYLSDVGALARAAHDAGALLLVDEAHGSHLRFHPDLPPAAVERGADLIVQSTHKTQGALTQTSMLHLCGARADRSRLAQSLAVLQSSSPNSILLASLDAARMQMATEGERLLAGVVQLAGHARAAVRAIPGLWCYGDDLVGAHGVYACDPTKLVIRVSDLGLTGLAVSFRLRREFGQDVEFADLQHIICSLTIGDDEASVGALLRALRAISASAPPAPAPLNIMPPPAGLPEMALTPRAATFAPSRRVPIEQSVGEVCAESIIPYPPGIPMLVPGERIAREHLDYLAYIVGQQMAVVGPEDRTLRSVRVVQA